MSKRTKAASHDEAAVNDASTSPSTSEAHSQPTRPPYDAPPHKVEEGAAISASSLSPELASRIKAMEERLAAKETQLAAKEAELTEAKSRIKELSQAIPTIITNGNKERVTSPARELGERRLTSEMLEETPPPKNHITQSVTRPALARDQKRVSGDALGSANRLLVDARSLNHEPFELHWPIPSHLKAQFGADTYVVRFVSGRAYVPQMVADFYVALNPRYRIQN